MLTVGVLMSMADRIADTTKTLRITGTVQSVVIPIGTSMYAGDRIANVMESFRFTGNGGGDAMTSSHRSKCMYASGPQCLKLLLQCCCRC